MTNMKKLIKQIVSNHLVATGPFVSTKHQLGDCAILMVFNELQLPTSIQLHYIYIKDANKINISTNQFEN